MNEIRILIDIARAQLKLKDIAGAIIALDAAAAKLDAMLATTTKGTP